jgi:hypothetical protein
MLRTVPCVLLALSTALACDDKRPAKETTSSAPASALVSAAPPAAPPPNASANAELRAVAEACSSICERSRTLECEHADECVANCLGAAAGTPCSSEFSAFYGCLLPQPIKAWECADDGVAAIREGICDAEQERVLRCMERKTAG